MKILIYHDPSMLDAARVYECNGNKSYRNIKKWRGEIEICNTVVVLGENYDLVKAYQAAGVNVVVLDGEPSIADAWAEIKHNATGVGKWTKVLRSEHEKTIEVFINSINSQIGPNLTALSSNPITADLPHLFGKDAADILDTILAGNG